ncbi:SDR family NAD(P)-dependent oxidoreductase [Teichococcus oryzae]|uniref:SDR family oxidoreductase n=1 Tax=Teichococcus oryzae TaxID=1608942 RepID=A0A5B2TBM8_9PROT|nr:SDR family oxidoreductase [Pseudoroseomonas oryzae]KAA2211579.1 SDR family oxidoreductase [Pseudoroseomonas oryzae]
MSGEGSRGRGRVATVIGGGNGIGAATCRLLARQGWRVAVADLDTTAALAVAQDCEGWGGAVDVLDEASIRSCAARIETEFGPVHAMVSAAAIFAPRQPPEDLPLAVWDRIVQSGYRGTYVANVEFGQRMARRGAGVIVNISSMVGQRPNHGHAYYSAKAAVNMLTEGMAGEWGRSGVRVNAVSPGFVAVPRMVENIRAGTRYAVSPAEVSALGRLVEPDEVASVIAFLLSDEASAVTGANIPVDAGVLAVNGWAVHGGVPPARSRYSTDALE